MNIFKKFFSEFGFEPGFNNAVLFRLKNNNVISRLFFGISRILGRAPFMMFKPLFYPELNSRIVEMPFVFQNIPDNKQLKILDFGCSESALPVQLATLGYKVTGIDLQSYDLKHPNFTFVHGDFLKSNIPDNHFDVCTAVSAIEHSGLDSYGSDVFSEGDIKIVEEIKRKLKDKGLFIVTVPFGKKKKDNFMRVYNYPALKNLVSGFNIMKEEYYLRSRDKTRWIPATRAIAEKAEYSRMGGHDGVACLVCEK